MANAKMSQPKFLPRIENSSAASTNTHVAPAGGNPFETDDDEIFSKHKMTVNLPSDCSGELVHLSVSRNWMFYLLAATHGRLILFRYFLPRPNSQPAQIALEKYLTGYKITNIFLDTTGHHLIISLVPKSPGVSPDFLYIHSTETSRVQLKVRRIEKLKDHEITSVAFNTYHGTDTTTGSILLGTSRGLIFETELGPTTDTYRKKLYDLGQGLAKYPINGLEVLRVPNSNRWIVVATTPNCIYSFEETLRPEERSLQPIFASYVNGERQPYCEKQKTDLGYSLIRFFAPPNSKYPKQWAWLCGAGIRIGELSIDSTSTVTLLGDTLINLDFEKAMHLSYEERRISVPKTFVLTEYHAVLLYMDHIRAICLLNQELVYHEVFDEVRVGRPLNMERDAVTGIIYVYTDKSVFTLQISREERNIWRIYLNSGQYELATAHAAEDPENLQLVLAERAEAAFMEGAYEVAANYYAETDKTFETVCLKFMDLPDKRPIVNYVKKRLNRLTTSVNATDESQADAIKALVIWLIDLYLTQINTPGQDETWRHEWQTEYDEFMREEPVLLCTSKNRTAVRQLIAEHADPHSLAQFAISINDYDEVIGQQLKSDCFAEALQTLCRQRDLQLYYKYAPQLMVRLPRQTIDALIALDAKLDIEKIVPTLVVIDTQEQREHVIRYLRFAVLTLNTSNNAIHNFLLQLYAQHEQKLLMEYLYLQGQDESLVHYDIHFALKVCTELGIKEACVFLQCMLCMWTTAVDLALEFDMKLAKKTALIPKDNETRRKLWLRIAYHEIKGTNDVKKALSLLKDCDYLLQIEDLLPFFSDFEKIDNFKEAICDALKDYNQRIQELQREMCESKEQSERVCKELRQLKAHSIRMEAQDVCDVCDLILLVKPFFVFICGHKFHSDCLDKQVAPMLGKERSRRLSLLKQQMETLMAQTVGTANHTPDQQKKRIELKTEIEEILAADCLYCGLLIETIDQPLVENWDQVNLGWE
ncbi:vacuolar protein sorting-associated protein 18 homolog [Drosophila grimshawi]|uniref:Vacuolar protein sorting-associated protein 18 homolog n=1 Tax=Drosophila grimshawi TaxID=7222 RepID=B4JXH6_DROGR|nr:vacuolar protein sorting-associated protein 18 homolog [Drosophila grimshawi]EDV95452.1 GH17958 [Drosophila grimshawi]